MTDLKKLKTKKDYEDYFKSVGWQRHLNRLYRTFIDGEDPEELVEWIEKYEETKVQEQYELTDDGKYTPAVTITNPTKDTSVDYNYKQGTATIYGPKGTQSKIDCGPRHNVHQNGNVFSCKINLNSELSGKNGQKENESE